MEPTLVAQIHMPALHGGIGQIKTISSQSERLPDPAQKDPLHWGGLKA